MGLEQKQSMRQTLGVVMTPQLRQAIKILQVSRLELEHLVDQELTENPVLEEGVEPTEDEERPRTEERLETQSGGADELASPEANRETTADVDPDRGLKEIDWKEYLDNYSNDWHGSSGTRADRDDEHRSMLENTAGRGPSLTEHLLWQLRMNGVESSEEPALALLLGNMDEDGYLQLPIEDIAFQSGQDFEVVEGALRRIQILDPPGVGARGLRECLLLQLERQDDNGELAAEIIRHHLELLQNRRYDRIARDLGVDIAAVVEATHKITTLEPKPGRDFGGAEARYILPDVFVHKIGGEYVVTVNEDGLPRLRVSSYYRQVLGSEEAGDAKRYIQEKMRAAAWLIQSIHRRQRTLWMVTRSIVRFQEEFLDYGISHLKPLVLKDVAQDIAEDNNGAPMHESTVSRATSGKYVHTPQGIFELKFFFTSKLESRSGEDSVSAESVKERIREIVAGEDVKRPYSDQYIARELAVENIKIARRTVAKYREMMGILPSSKRRQVF